jgi:hypothetical protein
VLALPKQEGIVNRISDFSADVEFWSSMEVTGGAGVPEC